MKRFVLLILAICLFLTVEAQKTKREEIYQKTMMGESITALFITYEEGGKTDTIVVFSCQDHRYEQLTEYINLYSGDCQEFYDFMCAIEKFCDKNEKEVGDGVEISETIEGHRVRLVKNYNILGLYIYESSKDGNGYHSFAVKKFKKIKPIFVEWCKNKNIKLDLTEK